MKIDHLMWACADLDAGVQELSDRLGLTAEFSGSHTGLGTRNALLSLGKDCYLEIIAPDPNQKLEGNFGGRLSELKDTGLLWWAVSRKDLEGCKADLASKGVESSHVQTTHRENPTGDLLTWQLLFVKGLVGAPFFIDWLDCVHPATISPGGCGLKSLRIQVSELDAYQGIFEGMDKLEMQHGSGNPSAVLTSPKGEVTLTPLNSQLKVF